MKTVNVHEAKTHLSRLLEEVAAGAEILIAKAGKPMARLVPASSTAGPRVLGSLAGHVQEAPDCWEADPELEALFYEEDVVPKTRKAARVAEKPPARKR